MAPQSLCPRTSRTGVWEVEHPVVHRALRRGHLVADGLDGEDLVDGIGIDDHGLDPRIAAGDEGYPGVLGAVCGLKYASPWVETKELLSSMIPLMMSLTTISPPWECQDSFFLGENARIVKTYVG
jgi:hypothetical protein